MCPLSRGVIRPRNYAEIKSLLLSHILWSSSLLDPSRSQRALEPIQVGLLHASPDIAVLGSAPAGRRILFQANRHGCFCSFIKHSRDRPLFGMLYSECIGTGVVSPALPLAYTGATAFDFMPREAIRTALCMDITADVRGDRHHPTSKKPIC